MSPLELHCLVLLAVLLLSSEVLTREKHCCGKSLWLQQGQGQISFLSFLLNDQRVTSKCPHWGWKLVELASTKEQGTGTAASARRNVSLAPTRHPNLNCCLFFFFLKQLYIAKCFRPKTDTKENIKENVPTLT